MKIYFIILLLSIVKVFAPIMVNSFVSEFVMESMAVRIPTRAIIPKAIIEIVKIVLKRLVLID